MIDLVIQRLTTARCA